MGRVCMLGLDGLSPDLLFVDYGPQLPNFMRLAQRGGRARLRSCEPPITVPAWACMMTGQNPGALGCYGFHDRSDRSYHARRLASSLSYFAKPLWTRLSEANIRCRILGVPQTYPAKPLLGAMVTGALTPDLHLPYAIYPPQDAQAVHAHLPAYACDIEDFRKLSPAALVARVNTLTDGTFGLLDDWFARSDWDFLCAVDMGADRLQHGLWHVCRPEHPRFEPGHPQALAMLAYYRKLDAYVGRLLDKLEHDDVLMVVSDHGAQAMHGGFAINDWLVAEGYLVVKKSAPSALGPTAFDPDAIDWPRTKAWADGGYVGRIYLNVQGREPLGCVDPKDADAVCAQLCQAIEALPERGHGPHKALRPCDVYGVTKGIAPDLMVYMGGLRLRTLGTMGHDSLWPAHNDRGLDAANHAHDGIIVTSAPWAFATQTASLYDIAPSILTHFGLQIPQDMSGRPLFTRNEKSVSDAVLGAWPR